jgi:hypothetical protein
MTYKEALLFIGKSLTLNCYPGRADEIRSVIRSGSVIWEQIVSVGTAHFVFPALYLQFKRSGILPELPADLVVYMEEFAAINRQRNQQIIEQAIELTTLLNLHGISPVFLKGTAHLLDGLYDDIAERMVGDIDFLVDENLMQKAAELLISNGYEALANYNPKYMKLTKHYPRLKNDNRVAAVEIHRQILRYPNDRFLDSNLISSEARLLNQNSKAFVLSYKYQIIHNILNVQLNDSGWFYAKIFYRQMYDLLLLSGKENPFLVVKDFGKYFQPMNANLALTSYILCQPNRISSQPNWQARMFLARIKLNLNSSRWERFSHVILYFVRRFSNHVLITRSFFDADARNLLLDSLKDPKWYGTYLKSYKNIR